MPAVDYRYPGGITWEEAAEILGGLLSSDRARGLEVTIFNLRLDPDGTIAPAYQTSSRTPSGAASATPDADHPLIAGVADSAG